MKITKKEIFTIPNIMGYIRILLIPVFCSFYLQENYIWASIIVFVSSVSDLLDGKIARRFHMVTDLGKIIDPVADKLTHVALAICLAIHYPWMRYLFVFMIMKETYMAIMGIILIKKGEHITGALWCGKVCTTILFIGMLILFLFPNLSTTFVHLLICIMAISMMYSLCRYIYIHYHILKRLRENQR